MVPLLGYRVKRTVSLPYARALRDFLAGERFDLVHAHVYASQAAAALATIGLGLPLVMTEHSEGSWQARKEQRVLRWYAARARRIVGVSSGICRRLSDELGVDSDRIACIPNAVPAARGRVERVAAHESIGSGHVVGVVGRLCHEKGQVVFLEAVARAAPAIPDAHFLIVGGGESLAGLRTRARALGVANRVAFLGAREDARALMAELDLLVVPSLSEGSPLVVLEALDVGVPVLASRVGGIPDQIEHGTNGILVSPGDAGALAGELARLLGTGHQLEHLAAGARRPGGTPRYESMLDCVEQLYEEVQSGSVAAGSKGSYSFSAAV
jgi:glycosyltransferase involved in cell wall biosynthesis